ncbi:baseplate J/gp47 family protein [Lactococcus garvieae]|uniref:baseplate J/gp47 family protein n=1 Tax=Lactococcus garvieae TaxID=1363 RepID=UPI001F619D76|nr:baseplate J/gp47 family protein [Lactococcus garvieae]MCI3860130.1 baseplate J/gp47 family protein [Lactococcus garvieae]
MTIGEEFEKFDYSYYLNSVLERVPDNVDKREGSIIYDAVAPVAYAFAEMAMNMRQVVRSAYVETAWGEYLDYKAAERGTSREPATYARVEAIFTDNKGNPLTIDLGDRFSSTGAEPVFYTCTKVNTGGQAELTAETPGIVANGIVGQLLPITPFDNLGKAEIQSVSIPARDLEDDETLRKRLLNSNEIIEYGGNVADYISFTRDLADVAAVQVYPTWRGGGTVRLVILDNAFNAASQSLIDFVQNEIDPQDSPGDGYGIAPIGHTVTVAAPTVRKINVSAKIETDSGITVLDVKDTVTDVINKHFENLRKSWDTLVGERGYKLIVYRSQLISAIIGVDGVVNVASLLFDNLAKDVVLTFSNDLQELPVVGAVTLDEQ